MKHIRFTRWMQSTATGGATAGMVPALTSRDAPRAPNVTPELPPFRDAGAVRAVAPGGIGNIGPGLDILGCAVTGLADEVVAWRDEEAGVRVEASGHPALPSDPARHASAIAATAILARAAVAGQRVPGVALHVVKRLPLAGGQGGSAASAVAGAAAANALLDDPLDAMAVLQAAFAAESVVAGHHLDNVAPCVLGGIVLIRATEPPDLVRLTAPRELRIVLALPAMQLATRDARAVLPAQVDRATALHQAAQVAAIVAACASDDIPLLGRAIDDRIAEPVRAPLLPGFTAAKRAAYAAGAHGCSISGAGPTSFAFATSDADADRIAAAMQEGYRTAGVDCTTRIARVSPCGVQVELCARPAAAGAGA